MKTYLLSFADSTHHVPEHPERTARRTAGWDVVYQVWPSRESMLTTIRMQRSRARQGTDWRACVED